MVGRGGNSRNWLSPLFTLIHYSMAKYDKYYRVEIQGKKWYVHRLVAFVWLPNPENLPCVGHKDNNPLNNRVSNLYWCTQEENMKQMIRDGRSLLI